MHSPYERGHHAARTTVEQLHVQAAFQLGERLGHRRLGDVEIVGNLDQAAEIVDRHQQLEVAWLEISPYMPVEARHRNVSQV